MKYKVKVFDNACCAMRGMGKDSYYTENIEAKDDMEALAICAMSKILDYYNSDREEWLGNFETLRNKYAELEEAYREDEMELPISLNDLLVNPLQALEDVANDGADGGWEIIISVKRYSGKEYLYQNPDDYDDYY